MDIVSGIRGKARKGELSLNKASDDAKGFKSSSIGNDDAASGRYSGFTPNDSEDFDNHPK